MAHHDKTALLSAVVVLLMAGPPPPLAGAFFTPPRLRPLLPPTTVMVPVPNSPWSARSGLPVLLASQSNLSLSRTVSDPGLAAVDLQGRSSSQLHVSDGPILITPTFNSSSVDSLILRARQDISQVQRRAKDDVSKLLELDKAAKSRARADVDIVWKSAGTEPLVQRIIGAGEDLLSWVRWQVDRNARGNVAGLDLQEELRTRIRKGGPTTWPSSPDSEDLLSDMHDWRNIYFGSEEEEEDDDDELFDGRAKGSMVADEPDQSDSSEATAATSSVALESMGDFPLCEARPDEGIAWFRGDSSRVVGMDVGSSAAGARQVASGPLVEEPDEDDEDLAEAFGAIYDPMETEDEDESDEEEEDVFELVDTVIAGKWRRRKQADGKEEIYFDPSPSSEIQGGGELQ